jgi:hypothetical protein
MIELGYILRSLVECPLVMVELSEMSRARIEKILTGTL